MIRPMPAFKPRIKLRSLFTALSLSVLTLAGPARAFNYVADANGTWWGIQDADLPVVDTGSIRATQIGPGQARGLQHVDQRLRRNQGSRAEEKKRPSSFGLGLDLQRFNGEMMRGFGLKFDGVNRFTTTQSIDLGGVKISRSVFINSGANWGRWLDSFTNTTKSPIKIKVAFGGQSGMGASGTRSSAIVNTSSGDAVVTPADAWVEVATPLAGTTLVGGPQVTVHRYAEHTPRIFKGAMTFAGDWLVDTFNNPLSYVGHEGNFQAYVNTITIEPGQTRSLLHFVVLGPMVNADDVGGRARMRSKPPRAASPPSRRSTT